MVDLRNKEIVNLRTGKREFVFADLHQIYPDPEDPTTEFSIDELRARRGGWLEKRWEREDKPSRSPPARQKSPLETGAPDDELVEELQRAVLRERNSPQSDAYAEEVEEDIIEIKAPKQKKMKVFEVQNEPQTIKTNLDSPSRPRIRRRSTREPTMTINTKAATDEVYDIFNQPLKNAADASGEMSSDRDYDTETDDYTSAGDTMSMGRSCDASEMGEGDEDPETTGVSSWSEFSTRRHVPGQDLETPDVTRSRDQTETQDPEDIARGLGASNRAQDLVTPISEFPPEDPLTRTKFVPIPPADYEPPQLTAKDPAEVAFNRLPFMTPIVEMTELSMGALTGKRSNAAKTPCRKMGQLPMIDSTQETLIGPFWDTEGDVRSARMLQNVAVIAAADDLATLELGPSESPVKLNFELPTLPAEFLIDNGEADRRESKDMGPIIKDLQCNPVDESIKNLILDSAKPSLANYAGFNQYPYQSAARAPEIRKFIKSLARAASDKTISSLPTAPKLSFPDSRRQYTIKRELGKGAFAPVYLVDSREDDDRAQNEKRASVESAFSLSESPYPRSELEALKMEDPPSAWEFYITRQAHTRLLHSSPPAPSIFRTNASRAAASTIQIHELHLYEDECYLSMDYHSQGTLLDLVNISKADNAAAGNTVGAASTGLDETLAMFFTVELLRTVEALHAAGILHGDLKADNCLVRFEGVEEPAAEAWSAQYHPDGSHGWSAKGLTIIDFGRGIDMRAFLPAVQFVADWKTAAHDCAEMREMRPWTWQVDYHGLANVAHTLLFGRYIETVAVPVTETPEGGNGQGVNAEGVRGGKRYRLAGSLKRYWQTEIWGGLFDMLLNPGRFGDGVLLLEGLGTKREEMEGWLVANCEKGVGLRGMIRKFEGRLGGGNGSSGGRKK